MVHTSLKQGLKGQCRFMETLNPECGLFLLRSRTYSHSRLPNVLRQLGGTVDNDCMCHIFQGTSIPIQSSVAALRRNTAQPAMRLRVAWLLRSWQISTDDLYYLRLILSAYSCGTCHHILWRTSEGPSRNLEVVLVLLYDGLWFNFGTFPITPNFPKRSFFKFD